MLYIFTDDPITLDEAQHIFAYAVSNNMVPGVTYATRDNPDGAGTITEALFAGRVIAEFEHDGTRVTGYSYDNFLWAYETEDND